MKKVYILGDVRGPYRIQNVIKYFVDRPNEYRVSFNNYWSNCRPIKYFKSLFINTIHVILSDVIYVCILNVDIDIIWELLIAKLFRKKIIVDYYISIYEKVVTDEKWFKEKSIMARVAKKLDRFYLKIGNINMFLSNYIRERYINMASLSVNNDKDIVVPFCIEEQEQINNYNNETYNICWWGSYLPLHGIEKIVDAASILVENNYNVKFYFFGNNKEKAEIYKDYAKNKNVENVCLFENNYTIKNGKLREFLVENANLAMGIFGDSTKAKTTIANKVVDACAMKIPLVTGVSEECYEFFDGNNDIFMVQNTGDAIARKIEEIIHMDTTMQVEKAYKIYVENFSPKNFVSNMDDVLIKLFDNK